MSGCLTYEQLVQQSMNLKQKILSQYMEGATICVDLGRCKERVIALVAILAANVSYLPFDRTGRRVEKKWFFNLHFLRHLLKSILKLVSSTYASVAVLRVPIKNVEMVTSFILQAQPSLLKGWKYLKNHLIM